MALNSGKMRVKFKLILIFLAAIDILLFLNGCSSGSQDPPIKVAVPGDLYYLGAMINNASLTDAEVPSLQINFSENAINKLKDAKVDAVLLGREPTADEFKGLNESEIALDAVCIVMDENSYSGGQYNGNGHPTVKTDGLRNLTVPELTDLFSTPTGTAWAWNGNYYVRNPLMDPNSWLYSNPDLEWIQQPANVLHPFNFPVGEFDTQSVIYQDLGLNEKEEVTHNGSYLDPKLHLEQEVISFQYGNQSYYPSRNGTQDFEFELGFASRAVMTIAPSHVPVSVLSINEINPMTDTKSIYDGTYKFSRKIYLLTRQNSTSSVVKLADFLQSPAGQKLVTNAGYLPIIPSN
jgi:hypothetical protein